MHSGRRTPTLPTLFTLAVSIFSSTLVFGQRTSPSTRGYVNARLSRPKQAEPFAVEVGSEELEHALLQQNSLSGFNQRRSNTQTKNKLASRPCLSGTESYGSFGKIQE